MCPQPPQPVSDPSGLMSLQLEPVPEIRTMPPCRVRAGGKGDGAVAPSPASAGPPHRHLPRGGGAKLSPTVVGGGGHGPDGVVGDVVTLAQVGEAPVKLLRHFADGVFLVTPAQGQPLSHAGGSPSPLGRGGRDTEPQHPWGGCWSQGSTVEGGDSPANGGGRGGQPRLWSWPR